jgi:hypothetical protein
MWARSVSVGDDCNIFINIYRHLHSREPTLVPHPHLPDYLKLSIDPKLTCSFWIYFNSTWCRCICTATINKNKSFSKETLCGLSLLIEKKNRCYYIVNFLCTLLTLFFSEFSTKTVSITLYIFVSSCFYKLKNKWSIIYSDRPFTFCIDLNFWVKKIAKQIQLFTDSRFEMRTITSFVRAYIVTTQHLMEAIFILIYKSFVFSFFWPVTRGTTQPKLFYFVWSSLQSRK